MDTILKALFKELNATAEEYTLVNNYGYLIKGEEYTLDVQHTLNVYGVAVDYWNLTVSRTTAPGEPYQHVARYNLNPEMRQLKLVNIFKMYL